jgi:hypothetical protein
MNSSEESEADEAMKALTRQFSDPKFHFKAYFHCPVDGPAEFDLLFEAILDDTFGHNPNSKYKCWVRRLYGLGLISRIPQEWADPEDAGNLPGLGSRFRPKC